MCERVLRVSGVLAVVVLGLGMARKGRWAVPHRAAAGLELLGGTFSDLAEAAIFFFAGEARLSFSASACAISLHALITPTGTLSLSPYLPLPLFLSSNDVPLPHPTILQ